MPTLTNAPSEPIRWTLQRGAREFSISPAALGSKLNDSQQGPGEDGCYGTAQILKAVYGDLYDERLRRTREEADKVALQNAITRGEYLNKFELEQLHAAIAAHIKTVVRGSRLTREEQDDVLRSMSDVKFRVAAIAAAQRRGNNGDGRPAGDGEPVKRKRKPAQKKQAAQAEQPAAALLDG